MLVADPVRLKRRELQDTAASQHNVFLFGSFSYYIWRIVYSWSSEVGAVLWSSWCVIEYECMMIGRETYGWFLPLPPRNRFQPNDMVSDRCLTVQAIGHSHRLLRVIFAEKTMVGSANVFEIPILRTKRHFSDFQQIFQALLNDCSGNRRPTTEQSFMSSIELL